MGQVKQLEGLEETTKLYIVNSDKLMITGSRLMEDTILKHVLDTKGVRAALENGIGMIGIIRVGSNNPGFFCGLWLLTLQIKKASIALADPTRSMLALTGAGAAITLPSPSIDYLYNNKGT